MVMWYSGSTPTEAMIPSKQYGGLKHSASSTADSHDVYNTMWNTQQAVQRIHMQHGVCTSGSTDCSHARQTMYIEFIFMIAVNKSICKNENSRNADHVAISLARPWSHLTFMYIVLGTTARHNHSAQLLGTTASCISIRHNCSAQLLAQQLFSCISARHNCWHNSWHNCWQMRVG